jgi:GNAT superfamily N-acetyltransferase
MKPINPSLCAVRIKGNEPDNILASIYQRMLEQGRAHKTALPSSGAEIARGVNNLRAALRQELVEVLRIDTPQMAGVGAVFLSPLVVQGSAAPVLGCQVDDIVTARGLRGQGIGSFGLAAAAFAANAHGAMALGLECEHGLKDDNGHKNADFYRSNGLSVRSKIPYRINNTALNALSAQADRPWIDVVVMPLAEDQTLPWKFQHAARELTDQAAATNPARPLPAWDLAAWHIQVRLRGQGNTKIMPLASAIAARRWSLFRTAKYQQPGYDDGNQHWEKPVGAQIEWIKFNNGSIDKIEVTRAMIRALTIHMRTTDPGACSFVDWVGRPNTPFDSALAQSFGATQNTYSGAPERLWLAQGTAFENLAKQIKPEQFCP